MRPFTEGRKILLQLATVLSLVVFDAAQDQGTVLLKHLRKL